MGSMTVNGIELRVRVGDRTRPSEHDSSIGITSVTRAHRSPTWIERTDHHG
ncbi:hypothetical protein RESH_03047 [Rhodopirellula europaea SH398]|uniref:Uncharacterized protein n=1 Tax=Rhodopirellula europaea SH398 TaxID=1263868 RepID=M5SJL8_9BACT|nr:hypothetical protein RESH_03047 [Rhodopirellula europaea SH398]